MALRDGATFLERTPTTEHSEYTCDYPLESGNAWHSIDSNSQTVENPNTHEVVHVCDSCFSRWAQLQVSKLHADTIVYLFNKCCEF